ncbi:DNA primase large subunit isoform X2 [Anabrus simplex]
MRISLRHISESVIGSGEPEEFLVNVKHIFEELSIRKIIDHIFSEDHSTECEQYTLKAPFTLCLSLVKQRKVSLKDGVADIPCGVFKIFLLELFEKHIVFGMEQLVNTGCFKEASQDPRIRELRKELEKLVLSSPAHITPVVLKACDVDTESVFFPLCMTHLHRTLRTRHRLSHEWRRQYTLFLKDIGMPVEEAIEFWSSEYSLPKSNDCDGCCHSWQKDAKRFHYSIRHMYGLEGGRYHYMVASCRALQMANLQPSAEGGCPFKHFDEEKLTSYFPSHLMEDDSVLNYILQLKKNSPKKACQAHMFAISRSEPLKYSSRTDEGKSSLIYYSPAHYYLSLKNT